MAELILAEQEFSFTKNTQDDIHCSQVNTLELTTGTTYTVIWDDELYVCTAEDVELEGMNAVAIGDKSIEGIGADTEEPFLIGYSADYGLALLETLETDETHTITIYEGVLEEIKGANIVLYDRNGQPVIYNGIETVSFNTDDSKVATYTHGTATDEVAVALDLSAGDQTVEPADAAFMRKAVIQKPDNLKPENIRKGETVAGVEGTLIGEGVSKEVELNFADGDQTVEPDPDTLLSEVIIKKPDTLLPENIAKDVEVAGVVGTFKGGGAVSVSPSDINFYDYDGTIVAAWTLAELASATALPANPEHDGLTAQGWNWTLADLQAENRPMNVGQMYITDDEKTRLYISIAEEGRMRIPLSFKQTVANGVTIDWGDESTSTMSATSGTTYHTYSAIGDYVITLTPSDDCTLTLGTGTNTGAVMGSSNSSTTKMYPNRLKKVEIGKNTALANYAFLNHDCLETVTLPSGTTTIGTSCFSGCKCLKCLILPIGTTTIPDTCVQDADTITCVSIPKGVTKIGNTFCNGTSRFTNVTIPEGVTNIGNYCFNSVNGLSRLELPSSLTTIGSSGIYYCLGLTKITIPSGVTSIGNYSFNGLVGTAEYHFKPTTPPTLGGTSVFGSIPSDCIIYVPKGCLDAYKAATNWSTYASYMQEEPE